jgi:hypothetical protein
LNRIESLKGKYLKSKSKSRPISIPFCACQSFPKDPAIIQTQNHCTRISTKNRVSSERQMKRRRKSRLITNFWMAWPKKPPSPICCFYADSNDRAQV